jgi:hypothetical protein
LLSQGAFCFQFAFELPFEFALQLIFTFTKGPGGEAAGCAAKSSA